MRISTGVTFRPSEEGQISTVVDTAFDPRTGYEQPTTDASLTAALPPVPSNRATNLRLPTRTSRCDDEGSRPVPNSFGDGRTVPIEVFSPGALSLSSPTSTGAAGPRPWFPRPSPETPMPLAGPRTAAGGPCQESP